MRRSEAHQGVRMVMFRGVFGRYAANEVSQLEAAELGLGLTRFRGHPEAFTRGVPDADDPSTVFA
jgi:hypothetical protein